MSEGQFNTLTSRAWSPLQLNDEQLSELNKPIDEEFNKSHRQYIETLKAFYDVFNTTQGRIVLDYINKLTIDNPTWVVGPHGVHNGFYREGQNSIARHIKDLIEDYKQHREGDNG